jgi:predicted dehydrogenase
MAEKKRYAIVGLGSRSQMYTHALLGEYAPRAELVALCDLNPTRMAYQNARFAKEFGAEPLPAYSSADFGRMIAERKPDTVIVTSMDRTHHLYIAKAMEAGCDVITEKPMTIDAPKCAAIEDAIRRTGRKLRVTFNYRYAPRNSKVKEVLMSGAIGNVKSVHFEWLLDTNHGADYFRRWHRDKRNSGGLFVHKATHHFDLVNWWLQARPEIVYAQGGLVFYGRENAESRGITAFYDRGTGHPNAKGDPFALDLSKDEALRRMYLEAEKDDGYRRDQSVFGDCISIEDDMAAVVRYSTGATMSYHLTAYSPWEGYRVAFNGDKGRLEYEVAERSYVSGSEGDHNRPDLRDAKEIELKDTTRILVRPLWGKPLEVPLESGPEAGHGGGDARLLRDIFVGDLEDPLGRAADHRAGADSIMVGIAANRSLATGLPVRIAELRGLASG